jgi:hypothetical protein
MTAMDRALPEHVISREMFPKVYAYVDRFNKTTQEAAKQGPKPTSLKGEEAAKRVLNADYADKDIGVSSSDALGLKYGQEVDVWASDMALGFKHRDTGKLIGLNDDEVVISVKTGAGEDIRLHCPRPGFRVAPASGSRDQAKM